MDMSLCDLAQLLYPTQGSKASGKLELKVLSDLITTTITTTLSNTTTSITTLVSISYYICIIYYLSCGIYSNYPDHW